MRDLTKSMMSFSWAMGLFGLRQMTCMLTPQSWNGAGSSFDHVTRSTEDQLGSVTRSLFRAGDSLQRGMVDLMFNMMGLGNGRGQGGNGGSGGSGSDAFRRSVQWGADVMDRSADAMRQAASGNGAAGAPAASGAPSGETGWGPMPGTR